MGSVVVVSGWFVVRFRARVRARGRGRASAKVRIAARARVSGQGQGWGVPWLPSGTAVAWRRACTTAAVG